MARDKGLNNKYPCRHKKTFATTWKANGFKLVQPKFFLSLAKFNNKRQAQIEVKLPKTILKLVENKKLHQISLIWDNHLKLAIVYEDGSAVIITGRYLRSINRYQNKETEKLSKLMSRCKKYSRRWLRLRRAKRRFLNKTNNQIRDFNHKITRAFVNWAIIHNISKVYVGDVEGVERNTRKKKHKYTRQKLSRWNFGKHLEYTARGIY